MSALKPNEGWNIVRLVLPQIGELTLAFKEDQIRIRKSDMWMRLRPMEYTFPTRKPKNAKENLEARLLCELLF